MLFRDRKSKSVHLARTHGDPGGLVSICGMLIRQIGQYLEVESSDELVRDHACQRCEEHVGYYLSDGISPEPVHERSLSARAVELYVQFRNITDTARQLRAEDYRLPNGMSVQPQHIQALMAIGAPDMDRTKYALAYEIFEHGRDLMMRYKG